MAQNLRLFVIRLDIPFLNNLHWIEILKGEEQKKIARSAAFR